MRITWPLFQYRHYRSFGILWTEVRSNAEPLIVEEWPGMMSRKSGHVNSAIGEQSLRGDLEVR